MGLNLKESWTEEDHNKFMTETQYLQDELDSEEIDQRMPYSKQIDTVRQCLKDAFGEYSIDIKIVNRFLFNLELFMSLIKDLQDYNGPKDGNDYKKIIEGVVSGGNAVKFNIIDYGKKADDQMEEDLRIQGKSDTEINTIIKARYDKFLSLLKERIVYEERI